MPQWLENNSCTYGSGNIIQNGTKACWERGLGNLLWKCLLEMTGKLHTWSCDNIAAQTRHGNDNGMSMLPQKKRKQHVALLLEKEL